MEKPLVKWDNVGTGVQNLKVYGESENQDLRLLDRRCNDCHNPKKITFLKLLHFGLSRLREYKFKHNF